MNVALIFRKNAQVNKFHDIMVNSLNTGLGEHAIICSGFFQENLRPNSPRQQFFLTHDQGFMQGLQTVGNLTTIGIHSNTWLPAYRNFITNLNGVHVTALYRNAAPWHAKIYILERNGSPIFGMLGSSNMTGRAFGTQGGQGVIGFNHEADVVLWDDNIVELNALMNASLEGMEATDVMKLDYDEELNGASIVEQLEQLKTDLDIENLRELQL